MKSVTRFLFFALLLFTDFVFAASSEFIFKPLGVQVFPSDLKVKNKAVGGLSGIHFDARSNKLWAVSDSRKDFYLLSGAFGPESKAQSFWSISDVLELKRTPSKAMDLEGLSVLPWGNFILVSEGEQNKKPRVGPEILEFDLKGNFVRDYLVAKSLIPESLGKAKQGVRNNLGLESLAISLDQKKMLVMPESHLRQDTQKNNLPVFVYSLEEAWNLRLEKDLSYPFTSPKPEKEDLIDPRAGVSEVIWWDQERIFVLERSFTMSTKAGMGFAIQIFEWSVKNPKEKKLILDLNQKWAEWMKILNPKEPLFVGNFEAMTWGPKTASGERTLWLMTDNNFSSGVPTVLLGLSVLESGPQARK